jgi:hypothetical protein
MMKTHSMVELMDESGLRLRLMPPAGETGWERISADDVDTTWAELKSAMAVDWGMTVDDVIETAHKLVAGRKAVIGGGERPVYTVFWPTAGVGGEL